MQNRRRLPSGSSFALLALVLVASGCGGLEYSSTSRAMYVHKELPAADRAVEAARAAGKAQQCPDAFRAVEKLRDDAYATYWACHTEEAIAMAKDVAARAAALCPPAPRAAAVAPTVAIGANPATIQQGRCTTLTWTSANAATAAIDQGLGGVTPNGSREVCPATTTRYTIVAAGEGGSRTAVTTVTVTAPPPPPRVIERLTIHVNFDFDRADIRPPDVSELQKALDFVNRHATLKISIEGHTDGRGGEEYNNRLSLRRANAVKAWLVQHGATNETRMIPIGFGKSRPIASNDTDEGRFQNRRVELVATTE